ncbi:MAG: hypothetical protein ABJH08_02980 [Balneola sp.]
MKRLIALITFLSLFTVLNSVVAQTGITFKVTYNSNSDSRSYASKDIKEFHAFQKDVTKFSRAARLDNTRKARRIKNDVIRKMEKEVRDTKEKIRYTKWYLNRSQDKGLHQKNRRTNGYSKRSGSKKVDGLNDLRILNRQLEIQSNIIFKLHRMHLDNNRNFSRQAHQHKLLMQDFEATLKADINHSFKEYRNKNRRNH